MYRQMQTISVSIASVSSESYVKSAHMRRLDIALAARMQNVWMEIKAQTKIQITYFAEYVSDCVQ